MLHATNLKSWEKPYCQTGPVERVCVLIIKALAGVYDVSPQPNPVANAQLLVCFDDGDQPLSLLLRKVAQVEQVALRLHCSILLMSLSLTP